METIDELDNPYKEMSIEQLAKFPRNIREEEMARRNAENHPDTEEKKNPESDPSPKKNTEPPQPTATTPETSNAPETKQEGKPETKQEGKPESAKEENPDNGSESIEELRAKVQELERLKTEAEESARKNFARYSSLKGKYDSEHKKPAEDDGDPKPENSKEKEGEADDGDPLDAVVAAGWDRKEAEAIAKAAASLARKNANEKDISEEDRKAIEFARAEMSRRTNDAINGELAKRNAGFTVSDIRQYESYLADIKDPNGISAKQLLNDAIEAGDTAMAASVFSEVRSVLAANNLWHGQNEPPAAIPQRNEAPAVTAKPVTPKSASAIPVVPAAKSMEQIECELNLARDAWMRDKTPETTKRYQKAAAEMEMAQLFNRK